VVADTEHASSVYATDYSGDLSDTQHNDDLYATLICEPMTIVNSTSLLGSSIRDARRRQGLTQSALAVRAGVTQATVSNIERDVSPPSMDTVLRLLAVLRLELVVQPKPEKALKAPWEDG
jgi:HTH-type transcriptional regulator / antitoxin HipB